MQLEGFCPSWQCPLSVFDVMWDVANLEPPDAVISIDGVRLGTLDGICPEFSALLRTRYAWVRSAKTLARAEVQAPNQDLAKDVSRETVEEALDFLSIVYARTRAPLGDFDGLSVGENVAFLSSDPRKISSWWVRGRRNYVHVGISQALWNNAGSLWEAPPRPWESLPVGTPLRDLIQCAYRRFGQAVRSQGDANACIPLALSSLEILLGPERPNRYIVASRLVRASVLSGLGVPHPLEIAHWYDVRNEILHEGRSVIWPDRGASFLWDVYRILDALSALCTQKNNTTKPQLVASLCDSGIVAQAEAAVDKERQRLQAMQNLAISSIVKSRLRRTVEEWNRVYGQIRR